MFVLLTSNNLGVLNTIDVVDFASLNIEMLEPMLLILTSLYVGVLRSLFWLF